MILELQYFRLNNPEGMTCLFEDVHQKISVHPFYLWL